MGLGAHKRKGNLGFLTETTILHCRRISKLTLFLGLTWYLHAYAEILQSIPVLPTGNWSLINPMFTCFFGCLGKNTYIACFVPGAYYTSVWNTTKMNIESNSAF